MAEPRPGAAVEPRPGAADPAERGRQTIAARAVERIATAAARTVDGVAVVPTGLTTGLSRSYPRGEVVVAGRRVRARLEVAARWPAPAAGVAAAVRGAVTDQLTRLAGLTVDAVDVTVAAVLPAAADRERRVR